MSRNPFQNFVIGYEPGDTVYEEGDAGSTMYIVQSGAVRLFRRVEGRQHDLATMEKGDFFGEMSVLEGLPRTHSAVADDDCDLIEINSSTFDKMIRSNIEIAVRMLRKLSIRLREAERLVEQGPQATLVEEPGIVSSEHPEQQVDSNVGLRLVCPSEGVVFHLNPHETLVGRYDPVTEVRPDVDLTDVDLKRSVSRRHARVVRTDTGFTLIEEVGALNGTFVNGKQLTPGEPQPVEEGDELSFGMVTTVFQT